jgi:tetratricopeptide (TPR) repeat protein
MHITKRYTWVGFCALGTLLLGIGMLAPSGESTKATTTAPDNEIVLTIGTADRSALNEGDTLRKARKYNEAIAAYQKALDTQGIAQSVRAEADYDIGLSHLWLGEYDKAQTIYTHMFNIYKNDPNAIAYAKYSIAWIEVQQGQFTSAIQILQSVLAEGKCTDKELCSRTQFQIGKIYLSFLKNKEEGLRALRMVVLNYPGTKIYNHPWLSPLKESK